MWSSGGTSPWRHVSRLHTPFVWNTTAGPMQLSHDFKEFIESLNANQVRYLVVGGYAMAAHGHPRYTKDLDVWIEVAPDNADRIVKALTDFGFRQLSISPSDFLDEGGVVQLGYPPHRIDVLTTATGVNFPDCYARKIRLPIDGIEIDFIDIERLVQNKKATGRMQDLADVEALGADLK